MSASRIHIVCVILLICFGSRRLVPCMTESVKYILNTIWFTHPGGVPRKLNDVNTISTRWPGLAKKMYKHCRVWLVGLCNNGAENVPLVALPERETIV